METIILRRDTTHGPEYIFRWNGQLFVSKTMAEAQVKLVEVQNGSLFA